MKGNDLSNKQAPFVMFDIDSLLFLEKDKTVWTKLADMIKSVDVKYLEREIDPEMISLLQSIWSKHNVCIGLVTFELYDDYYLNLLADKLEDKFVPYTRIFNFYDWEELRQFQYSIYTFSNNEELLSYLSRKDAMKIDRIWEVL